jgi:hypothetical protein
MNDTETLRPDDGAVDTVVRKTPWWAISVGLHTIAILVLAYMIVLSAPAEADEVVVIKKKPSVVEPIMTEESPFTPTPLKTTPSENPDQAVSLVPDETTQTPDNAEFEKARGQSEDYVTRKPFDSRSNKDTIGAGRSGGGEKGGAFGGRKLSFGNPGGPGKTRKQADDAVLAALKWLARHQSADGSWGVQSHTGRCVAAACTPNRTAHEDFDTGVTGLATLAFLGAGFTHMSRDTHDGLCFGEVVKKALQWMQARQDPEGCVGPRAAHKYMYNHAIAALALAEAYGMTGSMLFRETAQRAIEFLLAAQNPGKAWRYSARCDNDTSVTGWAVMALKSAELAGLSFPRSAYDGTRAWLDEVTDANYYRVGYTSVGTGKVYCAHNQAFDHHESLAAIAMMARMFIDRDRDGDPRVRGGAQLIVADLPAWSEHATDFYYWYYASLALFQFDGDRGGQYWRKFEERMRDVLVKNQNVPSTGCRAGSWEPVDRWSCEGGRVYATAINALTLEVYYRYASVFTGSRK